MSAPSLSPAVASHAIPLFLTEVEALGGAERSILALARWFYEHGQPTYLLTYRDTVGLEGHAGFPLPLVELRPGRGVHRKVAALRHHLHSRVREAPAVLTSGYQPALHCALARTGRFHCLMHDTPSLFQDGRGPLPQRLRLQLSNWLIGRAMRRDEGVMIVTSEFLQAECRRDFGVSAAIARMGGLGLTHAFRRRRVVDSVRMLSASRIEANKRLDWILHALHALEKGQQVGTTGLSGRVDWHLDIAGAGSQLDAMRTRAYSLGLADRVHFYGFVSDAHLEQLYESAHLFLMPAVQGYGIPAIEALTRGIPVLLHRDSGVSDMLLDTPWATVLHGGEEELIPLLATRLEWLLTNQQQTAPPPPDLPTEDRWAERVAALCGYANPTPQTQVT